MSIIANTSFIILVMYTITTTITIIDIIIIITIIARVNAVRSSVAGCPSVTLRETSYLCR